MLALARPAFDRLGPQPPDHDASRVVAVLDEAGPNQRFHHVAEDVVAVVPAIVARLLAEAQVIAETDGAGHFGALGAADQGVKPLRELALVARAALVQPFGDGQ